MKTSTNTFATSYTCDLCSAVYKLGVPLNLCPKCGGLLEIDYDLIRISKTVTPQSFRDRTHTLWRWKEFLPLRESENIVSMGEGGTPLMPSAYAGPRLGLKNLYFKNDCLMPTGSFKDRGFSLAVSFAKELGIDRGLTYTSGNAGASFAAYANRAGMQSVIMVEYLCNSWKMAALSLYGSDVVILHYKSTQEIAEMLEKLGESLDLYQFVNFINPVRHEAMKTYAYEISETLNWRAPDIMFHPVGTGGGLWGAWKGFKELRQLDWINSLPRMVAVQPEACAHFLPAFRSGSSVAERFGSPEKTIAQSIASDSPIQGGTRVLSALYESDGWVEQVSDRAILRAMRWLGREGINAEPSAAASLAALMTSVEAGATHSEDVIVCVITGSGLKQPTAIRKAVKRPSLEVRSDSVEVENLLKKLWGEA